jgi:dUTP pyrophosphatase
MKEIVKIINKSKHPLPNYQTSGSAGMDLTASLSEPIILKPMERKLIPTDIYIGLPEGFEAQIRSRSGMAFKRGLSVVNGIGTIDSDYTGQVMVALINLNTEEQTIVDGDRVAQMVIAKYETISWEQVESLEETERGSGGFGSTDKKDLSKKLNEYSTYLNSEIDNKVNDDYNKLLQDTKDKVDEYINFINKK